MSRVKAAVKVSPKVRSIVERHKKDEGDLIAILQDLQAEYGYLPKERLMEVARELKTPLNRVYSVATFFRTFSLEPKGEHDVHVCSGTACHVRGAPRLIDELERLLKTEVRGSSKDGKFSLDTVSCVGSCALGPVITVDGQLYGKLTLKKLRKVIKTYKTESGGARRARTRGTNTDETEKSERAGKKKSAGKKS